MEQGGLEHWQCIDKFVKEVDRVLLSGLGLSIMCCALTYPQCPISRLGRDGAACRVGW
jgi:hypothetical protein